MKKWLCIICGWIYDEAKGWPADGIAPGTRWEDIPDDWECPECGVAKSDFEMLEISAPVVVESSEPVPTQEAPIVIIGSGYAGYQLAQGIRQRNADKAIVIYTADDGANYSKPSLSNALSREKTAQDLVSETLLDVEQRLDIRIHGHCKVHSIDSQQHTITTDFGQQAYSKLVFATGASPIKLPFAGNLPAQGAQDILSINDLQDYCHFREKLDIHHAARSGKGLRIAIIGNGLIGCEFANDLSNQGHSIAVIGLTSWPMNRLIPQPIGEQLAQNLAQQGVQWYLQNSVKNIDKLDTRYQLSLTAGETIEADLIISAIGLAPRIELAKEAGVSCDRGIIVNGGLRTNVADIYALGDCAQINGQLLPYIAPINHAVNALADCLLGKPRMAIYPLMPVIVKTPALPLTILNPPPSAHAEETAKWQVEDTPTGLRAFFKDSNDNILGFALSGDTTQQRQHWLEQVTGL